MTFSLSDMVDGWMWFVDVEGKDGSGAERNCRLPDSPGKQVPHQQSVNTDAQGRFSLEVFPMENIGSGKALFDC